MPYIHELLEAFVDADPSLADATTDQIQLRVLDEDEVLLREGERGEDLYLVVEGSLQAYQERPEQVIALSRMEAGTLFGERAARSYGLRTASVRALTPAVVARLKRPIRPIQPGDLQDLRRAANEQDANARWRTFEDLDGFDTAHELWTVGTGEALVGEGEVASSLWCIVEGSAEVTLRGAHLATLGPGAWIGEAGVLHRHPHTATVSATQPTTVLRIDADWFRARRAESPRLQAWTRALASAYTLAGRGRLTRRYTQLNGRDFLTNVLHTDQAEAATITQAVGFPHVEANISAAQAQTVAVHQRRGIHRELRMDGGRLVGLTSLGTWPDLPQLMDHFFDGTPLPMDMVAAFEATGQVEVVQELDDEPLCHCLSVTHSQIRQAQASGCTSEAQLREKTGCGSVCGGCLPELGEVVAGRGLAPGRVRPMHEHTEDTRSFFVSLAGDGAPAAEPGQHIMLRAVVDEVPLRRAYTVVRSSPQGYELGIKRESEGRFSSWLFQLPPTGARVSVSPPGGVISLGDAVEVVCLAGGIGVTLAMSIALNAISRSLPVFVHHSSRASVGFAFAAELNQLAEDGAIELQRRVTSSVGRLAGEELVELVRARPAADFFLCGPGGFADSLSRQLREAGVPRERIHVEVFAPVGTAPPAHNAQDFFLEPYSTERAGPLSRTLSGLARGAWVALRSPMMNWKIRNVQLNPVLAVGQRARRLAGIDPRVATEVAAPLGLLSSGYRGLLLSAFDRADETHSAARKAPTDASRDPFTPDGHTIADARPTTELVRFPGGVDTGWRIPAKTPYYATYVVRGRAAVKRVLEDVEDFDRGPLPHHYLQQFFGDRDAVARFDRKPAGLLAGQLHQNVTWKEDRAHAQRMFGPGHVTAMLPALSNSLDSAILEIENMLDTDPDRVVDVAQLTGRLVFSMFFRAFIGDVDPATFEDTTKRVMEHVSQLLDGVNHLTLFGTADAERMQRGADELREALWQMACSIRRAAAADRLTDVQKQLHLVKLIVSGDEKGPLSRQRLMPLLVPFAIAGHETTGTTLAWLLLELGRNPHIDQQLAAEIATFQEQRGTGPARPSDYRSRPWTLACFFETVRRYPPMHLLSRSAHQSGTMPADDQTGIGAFTYPKDALFLVSLTALHHDRDRFEDPHTFDPARFMGPEGEDAYAMGSHVWSTVQALQASYDLLPFGAGPGACVGRHFSLLESFTAIDGLLGRYRFELVDPEAEVEPRDAIIGGPPAGSILARIRRRSETG